MESTFGELNQFFTAADQYIKDHPKERSKVTLAIHLQVARLSKTSQEHQNELIREKNNIRAQHAATDEDGNIKQTKDIPFFYKKEDVPKVDSEIADLVKRFNDKKLTVESPYKDAFVPIPTGFDFRFFEVFKKFIFDPKTTDDQAEQIYLKKEEQKPTIQSVFN